MVRGFGGRLHPRHVRSIHNAGPSDDRGIQPQRQQHNSKSSGPQQSSFRPSAPRGRGGKSFGGRYIDHPRRLFCLFCGEDKGHTTRTCQVTIQKQKEIAKAEARQNQPKQVLHTTSCYSPYVPEYVGNQQPTASIASASHSQASWAQLPPPPPLAPTLAQSQQPEGHQHGQHQRDFREKSEARIVNSTVPESKHIYSRISYLWCIFIFSAVLFFLYEKQFTKDSILVSCNNIVLISSSGMLPLNKIQKLQKSFLRERRVDSEAIKVVPKGAQSKFRSYKSRS
jgi:hypothetical protein